MIKYFNILCDKRIFLLSYILPLPHKKSSAERLSWKEKKL